MITITKKHIMALDDALEQLSYWQTHGDETVDEDQIDLLAELGTMKTGQKVLLI